MSDGSDSSQVEARAPSWVAAKAGIGRQTLNDYVNDRHSPTVRNLHKLAKALDVRSEYLLTGQEPMSPDTWYVSVRPLYLVTGSESWSTPLSGRARLRKRNEFLSGFTERQRLRYESLPDTVRIVFDNLLARILERHRDHQKHERIEDATWRGQMARAALDHCFNKAKMRGAAWLPEKGQAARSTREWLAAIVSEMALWEDSNNCPDLADPFPRS